MSFEQGQAVTRLTINVSRVALIVSSIIFYLYVRSNNEGENMWMLIFVPLIVLAPGIFVHKFMTQKSETSRFSGWGENGYFSGSVSVPMPKTEEEQVNDQKFFDRIVPLSPIMLVIFILLSSSFLDENAIVSWGWLGKTVISTIAAWIALYFAVSALWTWKPIAKPIQILKGVMLTIIYAPASICYLLGIIGLMEALLLLFT